MNQLSMFGDDDKTTSEQVLLIDLPGEIHRRYSILATKVADITEELLAGDVIFGIKGIMKTAYKGPVERVFCIDDGREQTWRHKKFPPYKANRNRDDTLTLLWPAVRGAVAKAGFTVVQIPDREADDVIATMCRIAVESGKRVTIASLDKDLFQLVDDGKARVYNQRDKAFYREEDVVKKLGVPPCRVADYLAFVGDSSDNLPGVPGIGPTWAKKILEAYGTFGQAISILASKEDAKERGIPPAICKKIKTACNDAILMYQLVNLDREVPLVDGLVASLKR